MSFPPTPQEGDVYYTQNYVFEYSEGKWDSRVLSLAELNPNLGEGRGAFFPPFSAVATLRTRLSCADGKIELSTDKINFSNTITVDIGDRFFAEWSDDIVNNAPQGSSYTSTVSVEYLDLSMNENVEVNITSVDKIPDPFAFIPQVDTIATETVEANTLAMLGSINAPTKLWGSSDSPNAEINIADTGWQSIPATIGSALRITSKDEIRTRHECLTGALTETTTTLNIGYGDQTGEFETSDFVTTNFNSFVLQPSIVSPTEGGGVADRTPTLTGSVFDSVGGLVHGYTDWQVATDNTFTNIVWQSLVDTVNLESITTGDLGVGIRYARVRYVDNLGAASLWSETRAFFTPFGTGANLTQTSATNLEVNGSTTVAIEPGTYEVTLWGGGGGGAAGGGNGSSNGGGAGSTKKTVTYSSLTNVTFTLGESGGAGSRGSNTAGEGGSPGGARGLQIGSDFWNGGGGGGYSSALGMIAAGGGGGGGDAGSGGSGSAGGSGTAAGGREYVNVSGGTPRQTGGFTIPGLNVNQGTGCNLSGTYNASVSFGSLNGKQITVTLIATGPSGTVTDTASCITGSANLSVSFTGDYSTIQVRYDWCGAGGPGVSHDLITSWTGKGTGGRAASNGTGGGAGGGGGQLPNGPGSSGGEGGSNSGSFDSSSNGSGSNAGDRYLSTAYSRYFGDGASGATNGEGGGARIVKIS